MRLSKTPRTRTIREPPGLIVGQVPVPPLPTEPNLTTNSSATYPNYKCIKILKTKQKKHEEKHEKLRKCLPDNATNETLPIYTLARNYQFIIQIIFTINLNSIAKSGEMKHTRGKKWEELIEIEHLLVHNHVGF